MKFKFNVPFLIIGGVLDARTSRKRQANKNICFKHDDEVTLQSARDVAYI